MTKFEVFRYIFFLQFTVKFIFSTIKGLQGPSDEQLLYIVTVGLSHLRVTFRVFGLKLCVSIVNVTVSVHKPILPVHGDRIFTRSCAKLYSIGHVFVGFRANRLTFANRLGIYFHQVPLTYLGSKTIPSVRQIFAAAGEFENRY